MLKDIVEVRPLEGCQLYLRFEDGAEGIVDVSQHVRFDGVFEPLRERQYFERVRVDCQGRSKFGPLRRSKSRPVGEGVAVFVGRLERSLRSPFRAAQA